MAQSGAMQLTRVLQGKHVHWVGSFTKEVEKIHKCAFHKYTNTNGPRKILADHVHAMHFI